MTSSLLENIHLFVILSCDKILYDIFLQFLKNRICVLSKLYIKKSNIEVEETGSYFSHVMTPKRESMREKRRIRETK